MQKKNAKSEMFLIKKYVFSHLLNSPIDLSVICWIYCSCMPILHAAIIHVKMQNSCYDLQ